MANEFLPFGAAGGANVMSQSDYNALASRLTGFVAGIALSAQLNKVWRQSASIAALMGQLITNHSGSDALDNGNIATLLSQLETVLRRQDLNWIGTFGGTANALTASLTPAISGNYALVVGTPIRGIVSSTNTGAATVNLSGVGAVALTWPDGSALAGGDLVVGSQIEIRYDGTAFRLIASKSPAQAAADQAKVIPYYHTATWSQSLSDGVLSDITGYSTVNSNLGDSTFSGGILTVGTVTAGLWLTILSAQQPNANTEIVAQMQDAASGGTAIAYNSSRTQTGAPYVTASGALRRSSGQQARGQARQYSGSSATCVGRLTLLRVGA